MSTTTDQRDALNRALKAGINIMKKAMTTQEALANDLRDGDHKDDQQDIDVYLPDQESYHAMQDFIEKWKV